MATKPNTRKVTVTLATTATDEEVARWLCSIWWTAPGMEDFSVDQKWAVFAAKAEEEANNVPKWEWRP